MTHPAAGLGVLGWAATALVDIALFVGVVLALRELRVWVVAFIVDTRRRMETRALIRADEARKRARTQTPRAIR